MADQTRKYRPGMIVFREGESGDYACLVKVGEVEVVKLSNPAAPPIAIINPGMMFGELALLDNAPRMATARTKIETEVVIVDRARFIQKLKGLTPSQRDIFELFAGFVRETPVWVAPIANEVRPPLGEKAGRVQTLMATVTMAGLLKSGDPFLDVLGNMLVHYAKRRLPPPA
ncbi:MAG: cyclic nucleotide-binding domain-containing protein [Proteobacteria bacterium]|nr:cyclic nucleotide-binding domain-containing protein [Pseudomonadota bacterium]